MSILLEQGCISSENLGLEDLRDVLIWNGHIALLKASNIRLFDFDDELVWIQSKSGKYSPKDGYLKINQG